jgi:DNA polymerase elongation subunit (family B)
MSCKSFGIYSRISATSGSKPKPRTRAERDPARQHHLQALQNTFKILLNSFYGYLGFAQGHFADFDAAARVTQIGRDLLKKMIDWLNSVERR